MNAPMTQVRTVMVIDDHPIVREGLTSLLDASGRYRVGVKRGDATEAIDLIELHRPDVVIIDLMIGNRSSLSVIERIVHMWPALPVVCMSMHPEAAYGVQVAAAGARGFVTKSELGGTIIDAIDAVLSGERVFSTATRDALERRAGNRTRSMGDQPLSAREREILGLIGLGETKQMIATRIGRSANTVEAHRTNIKRKLGLNSNAELIRYATLHLPQCES